METIAEKPSVSTMLAVDYPLQGETIDSAEYTLRMSAPEYAKRLEVSIDQAEWRPCRKAAGHWWYDWAGYDEGEHEVIARVVKGEGSVISCEPHEFFVRFVKDDRP